VSDLVGELRAELAAWGAPPDAPEPRALRAAVAALEGAAASGDASRENLRSALDAAQRSRALAHAATLRGVVSSALPGVSDDAREALRRKVDELAGSLHEARDGERAWGRFRALYREAMGVLVEGARAELGARGDADALGALAGVAERLARDEVEDAGALYVELQRRWLAAPERTPSRAGGLEGFEEASPTAPSPSPVRLPVVKLRALREALAATVTLTPARELGGAARGARRGVGRGVRRGGLLRGARGAQGLGVEPGVGLSHRPRRGRGVDARREPRGRPDLRAGRGERGREAQAGVSEAPADAPRCGTLAR